MRGRRTAMALALLAAGPLAATLISSKGSASAAAACSTFANPGQTAAAIASAIVRARDGATICLKGGTYPRIQVLGAAHGAYVTVRPAPGASATVAGIEVQNSSFLRFQGLRMSAGFNMRDLGAGAGHDYQLVGNRFENEPYGIVLYGATRPIRKVLIERNYMRNIDFAGSTCGKPGYAGGQAVTLYYAEAVRIAHNTFKEVSWHYIQGGGAGPGGVTVEHNLFEGPIQANRLACTHLNVWQIWQGGVNDRFSNNIVRGRPRQPAAVTPILFETGPAGGTCSDSMSNSTISNNLFLDDATAYSIQVQTTNGLTLTHNTVVGSTYGLLVWKSGSCANGTNYNVSHNIVVKNTANGGRSPNISLSACQGACSFEYNVSGDRTAAEAGRPRHRVVNWRPRWKTTSWDPLAQPSPPRGYYRPRHLPFPAGYEGRIGP